MAIAPHSPEASSTAERTPQASSETSKSFLIFAAERSGSTTLCHTLALHSEITCVSEPFNTTGKTGSLTAASEDGLRLHLDMLYGAYTGIKHVWFWNGWPFADKSYHDIVLTHGARRVIFLNRRNVLQRAVSFHIASQTNVWHVEGARDPHRQRMAAHEINPIDPDWLRTYIDEQHAEAKRYQEMVATSGVDWMDLNYEDLYSPAMNLEARFAVLSQIVEFLGFKPIGPEKQAICRLLSPEFAKVNSSSTYRRIPNIDEIERRFGSAENGFLGDNAPVSESKPTVHRGTGTPATPPSTGSNLTDAGQLAVSRQQVEYLQNVVRRQNIALADMERRLTSTPVRIANAFDRAVNRVFRRR